MRIEPEQFKQLVRSLVAKFKSFETELMAHRVVLHALKDRISDIDESLEIARRAPALQESMRQRFDVPLEEFLKTIDESIQAEDLERWIREWKPTGPVN